MSLCLISSGPKGDQVTGIMAKFANALLRNYTAKECYTYYQGDHTNEVEIERKFGKYRKDAKSI